MKTDSGEQFNFFNMKTLQNAENQALATFKVVAQLTENFKKDYLEIVEKWLHTEFERKIELVQEYNSKKSLYNLCFDHYGRTIQANVPDGVCVWSLRELLSKIQNMSYELTTCASLRKYTPENFDTRAFKSFSVIEERIARNKSIWFDKEMKKTSKSFDNSLMKIAFAISSLEMNLDTINVKQVYVNNGIDITLTDGDKQVHAFTIIACGQIIRPHFRFLIKSKTI